MLNPEIKERRIPTQKINPLFVNRWSPRCMTGELLKIYSIIANSF
jgi:hypothetical protein